MLVFDKQEKQGFKKMNKRLDLHTHRLIFHL